MKHLSLAFVLLAVLGCVMPLSAQDEAEMTYFAYAIPGAEIEIHGVNPDTGEDVVLMSIASPSPELEFRYVVPSPDGVKLLLVFVGGERESIHWVDLSTRKAMLIYETTALLYSLDWNPDSTRISFVVS